MNSSLSYIPHLNNKYRLLISSLLLSFVEIMLIRWIGSNIYQVFFFTNFILIASFLGIGIGFLRTNKTRSYFHLSPILLAIVLIFCYIYSMHYNVKLNLETGNPDYFIPLLKDHTYPIFFTLPLIFISVVATLATITDEVARTFKQFPSLSAYRLEVLGALIGITLFSVLAYFECSPLVWGIVITILYFILLFDSCRSSKALYIFIQIMAIVLMLFVFHKESTTHNHIWSTYYKIQVEKFAPNSYAINVNGLAQQIIEPLEQRIKIKPFYLKPYEHISKNQVLDNVLIVGAGTGGDVAIALAEGAKHVDAVEIDAALYRLGRKLNVDKPYEDPRVHVIINDGRAFLQQTSKHYDLIIYALTDSLALVSSFSSIRLENYLYTLEGLAAAMNHLKPDGTFAIYNYYGARWFADRLANTLNIIYKHSPCFDTYSDWSTVLTINQNKDNLTCSSRWETTSQSYEKPATDNHPFIYLKENTLPSIYVFALLCMGIISYISFRKLGASLSSVIHYFDLFLMGIAFLLLETASIASYALLFGTTWIINSFVFIGILLSVYLAIEVSARCKEFNIFILYGLLLISLCIAWIVPINVLLSLTPWARFFVVTCIKFTPIFIANLIFAERFDIISNSTDALGVNLIGAVAGGLLEYSSLSIGYQNFPLIILTIYSIAFCWLVFSKNYSLSYNRLGS